jgi:hypothetical protein
VEAAAFEFVAGEACPLLDRAGALHPVGADGLHPLQGCDPDGGHRSQVLRGG